MQRVFFPLLIAATLSAQNAPQPAASAPLGGYSAQTSQDERKWEEEFRKLPEPQRMRQYMQRLSARPHHVGSPYDKDNAEWLMNTFKSWGLDSRIETFYVLFPTPKERVVELVEPRHFVA